MFSDPLQNIAQFGLQPGMHIADLGAGVGFYTIPVAKLVGGGPAVQAGAETPGKVYAVEVQKDLITKLKAAADNARLRNIEYLWGDIEHPGGTHLGDMSMDAVIAANILFQVTDKVGFVNEARRILKKGGRIFLIDWKEAYGGIGPAPQAVVLEDQAKNLLHDHGFEFEREISGGDHHYGLVYRRA